MRTFIPIVVSNGKGLRYEPLTIEKAVEFGERNKSKNIFFETKANGILEQLSLNQLKTML